MLLLRQKPCELDLLVLIKFAYIVLLVIKPCVKRGLSLRLRESAIYEAPNRRAWYVINFPNGHVA
jgi:hypothetical protein